MTRPTLSEAQEKLNAVEETAQERIVKHTASAIACAVVAVFLVQCTDRYWNESDFVKAVAACNSTATIKVQQSGPDTIAKLSSEGVVLQAMKSKNECVKDVLEFYQKTATLRPVITIDKDDIVR